MKFLNTGVGSLALMMPCTRPLAAPAADDDEED